jgi:hypothetical protein
MHVLPSMPKGDLNACVAINAKRGPECMCCHQCQRGRLLENIEQEANAC